MRGISWPGPELYWYYILFEDFIIHYYRRHHHHHPYSIISRVVSFYSFPFLPFFSWMQIKLLRGCASRRRPLSRTCDTAMAVLFGILLSSKCCWCVAYVARYKAENDQMCFLCFMSFCVFFFIAILFNRFVFYVFLCFFCQIYQGCSLDLL